MDPYAQMKQGMRWMWSLGDYGELAPMLEPAADALVAACDPRPGTELLDVAAGTGNVATVGRTARGVGHSLGPHAADGRAGSSTV